jgi:hypothetical protein
VQCSLRRVATVSWTRRACPSSSTGAAGAFNTTAEGQTLMSDSSRKVNTAASVGGSSTWHVADRLE